MLWGLTNTKDSTQVYTKNTYRTFKYYHRQEIIALLQRTAIFLFAIILLTIVVSVIRGNITFRSNDLLYFRCSTITDTNVKVASSPEQGITNPVMVASRGEESFGFLGTRFAKAATNVKQSTDPTIIDSTKSVDTTNQVVCFQLR